MGFKSRDWEAWYDRTMGPVAQPVLHVHAECDCDEDGWLFTLDVGNQGINPDRQRLKMDFKAREPNHSAKVLAVEPVDFARAVGDSYKWLVINGGDVNDLELEIRDVSENPI